MGEEASISLSHTCTFHKRINTITCREEGVITIALTQLPCLQALGMVCVRERDRGNTHGGGGGYGFIFSRESRRRGERSVCGNKETASESLDRSTRLLSSKKRRLVIVGNEIWFPVICSS